MAPYIDEAELDDADLLAKRDSHQTLRHLATAGAQVREAVTLAQEAGIERLARAERPRSVVVASLGGSSLVADVMELLAEPGSPVPVTARRNVPIPGWVGPLDLVVAVSMSGAASGPLAIAREAARRGADLLTVGAEDSPLAEVCHQARGVHVGIGRGRESTRTSLFSLLVPVLLGGDAMGLFDAPASVMGQVADRLDEQAEICRPSSESFVNPAKLLALQLAETVPVVLGDGPLGGVAAARASQMLSRTARFPCAYGELPDDASQIVACFDGPFTAGGGAGIREAAAERKKGESPWDLTADHLEPHHFAEPEGELMERPRGPQAPQSSGRDIFADPFLDGPAQPTLGVVMLRDARPDSPDDAWHQSEATTDAVLETARQAGARVMEATAEPGHPVTRLAGHIALTDFTSTYLALGLGLDPAVSPHVADLRDRTR